MKLKAPIVAILASSATGLSFAGVAAPRLGTSMGSAIGHTLGISAAAGNSALLALAATGLVLGITIVRRKQGR